MRSPTRERLKIGILGGGKYSAVGRVHLSALRLIDHVELTAACFSKNHDRNLESATFYDIQNLNLYSSLEQMIAKEKLSAVIVLTPTSSHYMEIAKILRRGINVISEKSLCLSSDQALSLTELAHSMKLNLITTFNYTGYPMVREMRSKIINGDIGEVHSIRAMMPQEGFSKFNLESKPLLPQAWRLQDNNIPTISLDLGVHLVNLVTFITKLKIVELVSSVNSRGNFPVVDDVVVVSKLSNRGTCYLWYSKVSLGHRNGLSIEVYGDKGSISWIQEDSEKLRFTDKFGNNNTIDRGNQNLRIANEFRYNRFKAGHPAGFIEAFANYYEDVFDELSATSPAKSEFIFRGQDSREGLKILEAVSKSSRDKAWVKIV